MLSTHRNPEKKAGSSGTHTIGPLAAPNQPYCCCRPLCVGEETPTPHARRLGGLKGGRGGGGGGRSSHERRPRCCRTWTRWPADRWECMASYTRCEGPRAPSCAKRVLLCTCATCVCTVCARRRALCDDALCCGVQYTRSASTNSQPHASTATLLLLLPAAPERDTGCVPMPNAGLAQGHRTSCILRHLSIRGGGDLIKKQTNANQR